MKRKYSLFEKQGNRWVQISSIQAVKEAAVHIFQDELLCVGVIPVRGVRSLRPVKPPVLLTDDQCAGGDAYGC